MFDQYDALPRVVEENTDDTFATILEGYHGRLVRWRALRKNFGPLPIGHQTRGLAETITDGEIGFLFPKPSTESLLGGIRRAFSAFMAKDRLDAMRRRAMSRSFSWDLSATCYFALYRKTVSA